MSQNIILEFYILVFYKNPEDVLNFLAPCIMKLQEKISEKISVLTERRRAENEVNNCKSGFGAELH